MNVERLRMSFQLAAAIAAVSGYLVGSLPFGLIVARMVGGVDIRRQGSGNIGATNVARVLGAKYGALVLLLDCLKGALPTALVPIALVPAPLGPADAAHRLHLAVLCGAAAILGHMFPLWIGLRGGKGVATALGVALVLAPIASCVALGVFIVCVLLTRIVSLSSLIGAAVFCGVELWLLMPLPFGPATWSLALFSTVFPALIVVRHRQNLLRLLRGEEAKFRFGQRRPEEKHEPPG